MELSDELILHVCEDEPFCCVLVDEAVGDNEIDGVLPTETEDRDNVFVSEAETVRDSRSVIVGSCDCDRVVVVKILGEDEAVTEGVPPREME